MVRPQRIEYPGAWYHVMNRGAQKRTTFLSTNDNLMFFDVVAEAVDDFGIEIHAYALMSNHYHLLVRTPNANLGRAMRHVGGVYTQRFNTRHGLDGPLFRGRYKAILIDADDYLLTASRYIHRNPLEAGLVASARESKWTSYQTYLGLAPTPRWLQLGTTLAVAGSRLRYERFVEQRSDSNADEFYKRSRLAPILGSESFRQQIEAQFRTDQAGRDLEPVRPRDDVVIQRIKDALRATPPPDTAARSVDKLTAALLGRECGVSIAVLAEGLGYSSEASCRAAISRFRRAVATDEVLAAWIEHVRNEMLTDHRYERPAA